MQKYWFHFLPDTVYNCDFWSIMCMWWLISEINDVVQKINILIVNQSIIDFCVSFFALLTAAIEVDVTRMSRSSAWDQFVCRIWHTALPQWTFLLTSTYGIVLITLERYAAVIHPVWYKVMVKLQWPEGYVPKQRSISLFLLYVSSADFRQYWYTQKLKTCG